MNVRYLLACIVLTALVGCGIPETPKPTAAPTDTPAPTPTPTPAPIPTPTAPLKVDPAPADPKAGGDPAPTTPAPKAAGKDVTVGAHTFALPGNWKEVPPANSMRKYQASIPKSAGDPEDGEFSVLTGGGGVDANINRWTGQFGGPSSLVAKREIKTASGGNATVVELQGAYSAMTMQGQQPAKDGYAQLGAVVTTAEGDLFLKVIGPKKTVDENKAAFDAMVGSFK